MEYPRPSWKSRNANRIICQISCSQLIRTPIRCIMGIDVAGEGNLRGTLQNKLPRWKEGGAIRDEAGIRDEALQMLNPRSWPLDGNLSENG